MADKKKNKQASEKLTNTIVSELISTQPNKGSQEPTSIIDQSAFDQDALEKYVQNSEQENQQASGDDLDLSAEHVAEKSDDVERTVIVGANRVHNPDKKPAEEKISFGVARPSTKNILSENASATDAQLMLAQNLKIAQKKLNDLEEEVERLRAENEHYFSASEQSKEKVNELSKRIEQLEKEKIETSELYQSEIEILKDSYSGKEEQLSRYREKVDELEDRLKQDLRKIRVRERELENRLEIGKIEKDALLKAKDEMILSLQRQLDQAQHELDLYKNRIGDLNNKIENNHEQLSRTVRALRLALTNLQVNEDGASLTIAPLKKAE